MSFERCWRAFYGATPPKGERVHAEREYVKAEAEDHNFSGLEAHIEAMDKTGRTFREALHSFLANVPEAAPEPKAPRPAPMPKPAPRQDRVASPSVVEPAKPPRPAPPAPGFEAVFAAWPKNTIPENEAKAHAAWDEAVERFGAEVVTEQCGKFAEVIRPNAKRTGLASFLTKVLPDKVADAPTASESADALVDMALVPKESLEGVEQEDAVAAWRRAISPEDRVSFRLACIAYKREKKALARERGGEVVAMTWESFLSRWRSVDVRKVGHDALRSCGVDLGIPKGKTFVDGLRHTVEVALPAQHVDDLEYWKTHKCDYGCGEFFQGCRECGRPEPTLRTYDVAKACSDVYAWAASKVAPMVGERPRRDLLRGEYDDALLSDRLA